MVQDKVRDSARQGMRRYERRYETRYVKEQDKVEKESRDFFLTFLRLLSVK